MTKTELIDAIASGVDGLTKAKAEQALNVTLAAIMESVGKGDAVSLIGFGTFSQGERAERMARNPRTAKKSRLKPPRPSSSKPARSSRTPSTPKVMTTLA